MTSKAAGGDQIWQRLDENLSWARTDQTKVYLPFQLIARKFNSLAVKRLIRAEVSRATNAWLTDRLQIANNRSLTRRVEHSLVEMVINRQTANKYDKFAQYESVLAIGRTMSDTKSFRQARSDMQLINWSFLFMSSMFGSVSNALTMMPEIDGAAERKINRNQFVARLKVKSIGRAPTRRLTRLLMIPSLIVMAFGTQVLCRFNPAWVKAFVSICFYAELFFSSSWLNILRNELLSFTVTRKDDEGRTKGLCSAKGSCNRYRRSRRKHIHHHSGSQNVPLPGESMEATKTSMVLKKSMSKRHATGKNVKSGFVISRTQSHVVHTDAEFITTLRKPSKAWVDRHQQVAGTVIWWCLIGRWARPTRTCS